MHVETPLKNVVLLLNCDSLDIDVDNYTTFKKSNDINDVKKLLDDKILVTVVFYSQSPVDFMLNLGIIINNRAGVIAICDSADYKLFMTLVRLGATDCIAKKDMTTDLLRKTIQGVKIKFKPSEEYLKICTAVDKMEDLFVVSVDGQPEMSNQAWKDLAGNTKEQVELLTIFEPYTDSVRKTTTSIELNNVKIKQHYYNCLIYKYNGGCGIICRKNAMAPSVLGLKLSEAHALLDLKIARDNFGQRNKIYGTDGR